MIEIDLLQTKDENAWDEYVLKSSYSTFYHQIGWRNVVEKTYGHKAKYLVAKKEDEIVGILPLFYFNSRIFGKKLVSLPFAPYGGSCANNKIIENMLIRKSKEISDIYDADYLEFRSFSSCNEDLINNNGYLTLILELDKNPDNVWKNKLNNKVRNSIRKANKSGLKFKSIDLNEFYRLYLKNMKIHGTPHHSLCFFKNIQDAFPGEIFIFGAVYNNIIVASTFLLSFRDTLISGWTVSDKKYNSLNTNDFLYWEVIKSACNKEYRFFDFGRSLLNSGTFNFKKSWGSDIIQLYYHYYTKKRIPDMMQTNPKRQKFAWIWRKMPDALTRISGPLLRKANP